MDVYNLELLIEVCDRTGAFGETVTLGRQGIFMVSFAARWPQQGDYDHIWQASGAADATR